MGEVAFVTPEDVGGCLGWLDGGELRWGDVSAAAVCFVEARVAGGGHGIVGEVVDRDVDWVGEAIFGVEVGGDVDRVCGLVVDSCLVEGVVGLLGDERCAHVGTEDGVEAGVVGEEVDRGGVFEGVDLVGVGERGSEGEEVDAGYGDHCDSCLSMDAIHRDRNILW